MVPATSAETAAARVASSWHTVVLVLALLVLAVQAALSRAVDEWPRTLSQPGARASLYVWIMALQWVWVGYVWFGVRRAGGSLRTLIDPAPWTLRRNLRYAAVGLGAFILWIAFQAGLESVVRPRAGALGGVAGDAAPFVR